MGDLVRLQGRSHMMLHERFDADPATAQGPARPRPILYAYTRSSLPLSAPPLVCNLTFSSSVGSRLRKTAKGRGKGSDPARWAIAFHDTASVSLSLSE